MFISPCLWPQGMNHSRVYISHSYILYRLYFCTEAYSLCIVYKSHTTYYTYTHTYTHIHTYTHTYTHIHTHIHTYIHTYIDTHIHTHTYIHTHIHTNIHTYTNIYTYTYIHTYIDEQEVIKEINKLNPKYQGSIIRYHQK